MKVLLGALALALLAGVTLAQNTPSGTFTGQVMDSACAKNGGHSAMIQKGAAKDAKDCTQKCVAGGASYVLYNSQTKTTYSLDDQKQAAQFAGEDVTVKGTLSANDKMIHVNSIQPG